MFLSSALFGRRVGISQLLKNWVVVYTFNFVGAIIVVLMLAFGTGLLSGPVGAYVSASAVTKTNLSFLTAFLKGVGCNWLVCLGVWLALSSKELPGKIIGVWIPVMAFVTLGFEHSIANMFFIPAGYFAGANITVLGFISNIVPVTLGNIVGGGVFVSLFYYLIHREKSQKLNPPANSNQSSMSG
jgi:formate/nitrite transporter